MIYIGAGVMSFDKLKKRHRAERDVWDNQNLSLRVHRAISWIKAAEQSKDNIDAKFLFYWIAFNAAYAKPISGREAVAESKLFRQFFKAMVRLDKFGDIDKALWQKFSGPIRLLLDNKYVFAPFWDYHAGRGNKDWQKKFNTSNKQAFKALQKQDSAALLGNLFGRIYVLRNQIVHGGATYGSFVNRDQLRDCANILSTLVPIFINLMMDNPNEDWDRPSYPVVEN